MYKNMSITLDLLVVFKVFSKVLLSKIIFFNDYSYNNNIEIEKKKNHIPITSKEYEIFKEISASIQMNYNLYSTTSNNIEGKSFNNLIYDLR